ncbi:hypothetical protein NDU88_006465 [Pleurodeles waltl]|uniref:Cadherin domain-containing protein n=1 Tax=Pleurodeles waltl TaxID=8319 RepID=A0AAV7PJU1_PLEWA|nr:hypothetical protein NDU88_006465 [Pleurodeles waltl]
MELLTIRWKPLPAWDHTERDCYSEAQTPSRFHSGAQSPRLCYSGAQTSKRCYSGATLLLLVTLLTVCGAASGQLRYSIPEEMRKGSFVGNVALDLGMDTKELSEGGARIVSRGRKQYFVLNINGGHVYINERIDRESICERVDQCLLNVEIFLEKNIKVYTMEVEIRDINDNAPAFIADEISLQVNERTAPGARISLPEAHDADQGHNSLKSYQLSANKHFTLDVQRRADGSQFPELVLEKSLDHEDQNVHHLILTATDGGDPVRSGTAQIHINVLDYNDNAPVFNQSVYRFVVSENVNTGVLVGTVRATDIDQGSNSEITYSFNKIKETALKKFKLNSSTGQIYLTEQLDFEEFEFYEFEIQGSDGILSSRCKVLIDVINVNDNRPDIILSSLLKTISENSPPGTVIALVEVYDRDSGDYGRVTCFLAPHLPFQLQKSIGSYHSLITDSALDREQVQLYNITITVTDGGTPPLSNTKTISLEVIDENDNPPIFPKLSYNAYIMENVPSGASVFGAKAMDLDLDKNAKITYTILDGYIYGGRLSSYISINSESGVIYALQSFDFEKIRDFQVHVKAEDGGSPPLASNVTVIFYIQDQNDNTPEILYPSTPTDGSSGVEMAPRSSEPGYLITKVVAVDADSGHNAWLSYQLLRATDQGLFTVGLYSGEIRTARPIMEKDAIKQFLVVLVKDSGQTPLSSSVTVTIVLADSMPEILHDISDPSAPEAMDSNLTLYLVIAVAVISSLFLFLIILLLAIRLHRWRESQLFDTSGVNFNALPASHFVGIDGVRAFLQTYSHDVFLTGCSEKSQVIFPVLSDTNTPSRNHNNEMQESMLIDDVLSMAKEDQYFNQGVAIAQRLRFRVDIYDLVTSPAFSLLVEHGTAAKTRPTLG